jgi:hypothetical protein
MTYRELSTIQKLFDKLQSIGDNLFTKVSFISSEIDLYKKKNEVLKAIHHWIKIHPLLNSRIVIRNNDFYFEFDNEMNKNLTNIKFLNYVGENDVENWKFLVNYDLCCPFLSQIGPLWRLYFLKLSQYKYVVVMNFHHSLTDGRNLCAIYQQLLRIIEDYCLRHTSDVTNDQYEYELSFPNDYSFKFKEKTFNLNNFKDTCHNVVISDDIKSKKCDEIYDTSGEFIDEYGNLFIKISDLLKLSGKNHSKIVLFDVPQKEFTKIIQICKKKGIKMTGFFEALCALAWYKTLKKYTRESALAVKYDVTANMRPYIKPVLENTTMGVYAPSRSITLELNKDLNMEEFWVLAKRRTEELHKFLESNEFFTDDYQEEREKWLKALLEGKHVGDIEIHYYLTNLGRMDNSKYNCEKIKIENFYCISSFVDETHSHGAFYNFCSFNDNLSWCFSYNSRLFKQEFIDDLVSFKRSFINNIFQYLQSS